MSFVVSITERSRFWLMFTLPPFRKVTGSVPGPMAIICLMPVKTINEDKSCLKPREAENVFNF